MNDLPIREKGVWIIRQYILMLITTAQWEKNGKLYPPIGPYAIVGQEHESPSHKNCIEDHFIPGCSL